MLENRPAPTNPDPLWDRYLTSRSQTDRNRLVAHHMPLVNAAARSLQRQLPIGTEYLDLVSAGSVGLIIAIDKFDPTRGEFEHYARSKIRHAIIDDLRLGTPLTSSTARRAHSSGSTETRAVMHPVRHERETWEQDGAASWDQFTSSLIRAHTDFDSDPAQLVAVAEIRATMTEAITRLNLHDRVVLALYYRSRPRLAQHEIAALLGCSRSSVSSYHNAAVTALQGHLATLGRTRALAA